MLAAGRAGGKVAVVQEPVVRPVAAAGLATVEQGAVVSTGSAAMEEGAVAVTGPVAVEQGAVATTGLWKREDVFSCFAGQQAARS